MASTADIQVNANRGRTTQELHREALSEKEKERRRGGEEGKEGTRGFSLKPDRPALVSHITPLLTHTQTHRSVIGSVVGNLKLIGTLRFVSDLIFKLRCER